MANANPAPHFRSRLMTLVAILVIFLFAITFVVQASKVPTESMENTLLVGDYLLADKLHFGNGGLGSWLLPYRDIRGGDIVVFHFPLDTSEYLVKRVVGVPGDHLRMLDGTLYVNGVPLKEDYAMHKHAIHDGYRDNFPAGESAAAMDTRWRSQLPRHVSNGDLVVPEGKYFVMGDNRDVSLDSRYWGFVPRENIVGHALMVYLSVGDGPASLDRGADDKLLSSGNMFSHLFQTTRWKRMFLLIR
ncbi:MAG TPA: signal peptidase I [Candidatus Angelobacter sp.]|nr:signal peptidase I [Candidatus Angelobacter sp.]